MELLRLQDCIKRDPTGYTDDFAQQYVHFKAYLDIFSLKPSEDAKDFTDLVTFVAQVSRCYPNVTKEFFNSISELLRKHHNLLTPVVRLTLVRSLILLRNRGQLDAMDVLPLFFTLFRCQDKLLRQTLFKHIIAGVLLVFILTIRVYSYIKAANKKHINSHLNRRIQNFLYSTLSDSSDVAARKSLSVIIELWRRHIWRDAHTINILANAAIQGNSTLMMIALAFFSSSESTEEDSDNEDDAESGKVVCISKNDLYKATKGTTSSKRKKQAKLKRVIAAMKKVKNRAKPLESFAALQLLHDPQDFAEKLFKRFNKCTNERFEVKLTLMDVISRVIGVHKLQLLNFYSMLQKFILPHQREAPKVIAYLVQAVHDEVPPDILSPVLWQLVNQFVHDRARPEVMTLGLKSVRSICERAPLVMTPDLLQDLALYKKFREKEVATAARGLIGLFREIAPGMLEKKDRGRDANIEHTLSAYGSKKIADRVEGADLLQSADVDDLESMSDDGNISSEDDSLVDDADDSFTSCSELYNSDSALSGESNGNDSDVDSVAGTQELDLPIPDSSNKSLAEPGKCESLASMRKKLIAVKKAKANGSEGVNDFVVDDLLEYNKILTEDDFARIKDLKHRNLVNSLMRKHGLKSAAKNQKLTLAAEEEAEMILENQERRMVLTEETVNPTSLVGKHKARQTKEDRLAKVLEGREGRVYAAAASKRHKKVGGLSNKQQLKKKNLPMAAKKSVAVRRMGKKHRR